MAVTKVDLFLKNRLMYSLTLPVACRVDEIRLLGTPENVSHSCEKNGCSCEYEHILFSSKEEEDG